MNMHIVNKGDFLLVYTSDCKLFKIDLAGENQRNIPEINNCSFMRPNDEYVTDNVYFGG